MKRSVQLLSLAAAGIVALLVLGVSAPAQTPGPGQGPGNRQPKGPTPQPKSIPTVAMAFRNDLDKPIVVQGHSIVGGIVRRGQPILIAPGKVGFDNNVPAGPGVLRVVSVFDGSQPSRVLVRNVPIRMDTGRDVRVLIRYSPNNPDQILIVPDNGK
jgi:hypothetical protein